MTQQQKVLSHLELVGSITPVEALHVHQIYRLAARVHDLKNDGHKIMKRLKKDVNGIRYAEYRLA